MSEPAVVLPAMPVLEKATETHGDFPGHRRALHGMDEVDL